MQDQQQAAPRRASAAGIIVPARKQAAQAPTLTPEPSRASAAGLRVPAAMLAARPAAKAPALPRRRTQAELDAFLDGLRALRDSLPPNQNDRAVALIEACIAGGIRKKPRIVSLLVGLGLNNRHAGAMVDWGAKASVTLPRWRKGADGLYSLTA